MYAFESIILYNIFNIKKNIKYLIKTRYKSKIIFIYHKKTI